MAVSEGQDQWEERRDAAPSEDSVAVFGLLDLAAEFFGGMVIWAILKDRGNCHI